MCRGVNVLVIVVVDDRIGCRRRRNRLGPEIEPKINHAQITRDCIQPRENIISSIPAKEEIMNQLMCPLCNPGRDQNNIRRSIENHIRYTDPSSCSTTRIHLVDGPFVPGDLVLEFDGFIGDHGEGVDG